MNRTKRKFIRKLEKERNRRKKTTEVLRTEIDGCIQTLQEAAKDAEKRQQYLERFSHENQEDLMTVPKENIHIPEEFLNTKPEARKTAVAKDTESVTADTQTLPEPKKMKKEKRSLKKRRQNRCRNRKLLWQCRGRLWQWLSQTRSRK